MSSPNETYRGVEIVVHSLVVAFETRLKGLVINLIKLSLRSPPLCKNSKNMSQQKIGSQTQNTIMAFNGRTTFRKPTTALICMSLCICLYV